MLVLSILISTFMFSIILTPLVKKLALNIGAIDHPNKRKVHTRIMPRMGGLAIYLSFLLGFFLFSRNLTESWPILTGGTIIVAVGILDDKFQLQAKVKLLGQILAALVTVFGGIQMDFITLPLLNRIEFGVLAIPISIIWIIGVTNAINLIDGLDGLAAGVSSIILSTLSFLAFSMGETFIALITLMLVGSTIGFLTFNFHPAKIFMGDTGSLFLGYMISVLSIAGLFKNVTFFSLLIPVIILGVPLLDTLFAMLRRFINKKPLMSPDKDHLHHCLIRIGFTHKQTVILIYGLSGIFSVSAIIFERATLWGSIVTLVLLLILIELIVEATGLISKSYRPILNKWLIHK
jgi:UDP-GlcNAc:undecaprenyl-phosphate GlcNAc-1-phosphate transferase